MRILHAFDQRLHVAGVSEVIWLNDGMLRGVLAFEFYVAPAHGMQENGHDHRPISVKYATMRISP